MKFSKRFRRQLVGLRDVLARFGIFAPGLAKL